MGKAPGSPPAWALNTSHCSFRWDSVCTCQTLYLALPLKIMDLLDLPSPAQSLESRSGLQSMGTLSTKMKTEQTH